MSDDVLVLIIVLLVLLLWGMTAFRRWLYQKPAVKVPEALDGSQIRGDDIDLLTEHGYQVTHGRWKIGMIVRVDDQELRSSLLVDYFAEKDDSVYIVKLAKPGKPLNLTMGSAVREQLLSYALLYEETAGVLYVDVSARKVHQIRFELEL